MIWDYFRFAFGTFRERKIRTFLTMLGIFIGIATIVALVSLGQGLEAAINEQFEMMGTDKIMVLATGGFFGMGTDIELTTGDLNIIKKVKGVEAATGFLYKISKVEFKDQVQYTYIFGMPQDPKEKKLVESMNNMKVTHGRDIEQEDRYKAVIGIRHYEEDMFDKAVDLRDKLLIEGQEFKVIGVLNRIGNPEDDSSILVHIDTARELFDEPEKFDMLIAQAASGEDPEDIAEDIKKELRQYRDVKKGEEDFEVQTSAEMMDTYGNILDILQWFLIGISLISLFVGGVGIMNTMYTSVLQRTNDIGVMKAIGAKNSDILWIFLIESGLLGLAGGIIGILIGMGFSDAVARIAVMSGITMIQTSFPPYLIIGTLAFSFIVGTLSGVMPARAASKMNPVDALRYE